LTDGHGARGDRNPEHPPQVSVRGAFLTTFMLFFLMEIGDKTQVANAALAAHFETVLWVLAVAVWNHGGA
jgi:Ca2+/H+ antiporter, TMEM165/GDT1 family